ncbi:MAG: hypothetical protein GKR93_11985 [Gammaproteobacteria bacterium]|nr:hypothetical protein [Gammaproteobacteria bacterium]
MALSKDKDTPERQGNLFSYPVAAASIIYAGALVALNAAGDAVPGSVATTLKAAGRCETQADNSAGSAADISVNVLKGTFKFKNHGADAIDKADVGNNAFIVDDETVAATDGSATRSVAGVIKQVDSDGVWVTIGVDRDAVEDDQYGVYSPLFSNMGFETARFPDQLVFEQLVAGFALAGYDGQFFFDTDHLGYDENGAEISYSNDGAGAGAPWFLMDTRRPLKPLIYQQRRMFDFVAKDRVDDDNVFDKKELRYGVDGRMNVGFGFHQMAYGSKDTLDAANFEAALAAMMGQKKRSGKPLGIKPNLMVCGPSNRAEALEVIKAERKADGATNVNRDAVDLLVTEWLS